MASNLTSQVYTNIHHSKKTVSTKSRKKNMPKSADEKERQNMIFKVKKAKREHDALLDDLKKKGILEFRVTDATNSVWQSVPENWDDYDLFCEEYRVAP